MRLQPFLNTLRPRRAPSEQIFPQRRREEIKDKEEGKRRNAIEMEIDFCVFLAASRLCVRRCVIRLTQSRKAAKGKKKKRAESLLSCLDFPILSILFILSKTLLVSALPCLCILRAFAVKNSAPDFPGFAHVTFPSGQ